MKTSALAGVVEETPRAVRIRQVKKIEWDLLIELVREHLQELGEPARTLSDYNPVRLRDELSRNRVKHYAFFALDETDEVLGLATVEECFALFANGFYGVVHELYVLPPFRGLGIGRKLADHVKTFGMLRNWSRLEMSAQADGATQFQEQQGFVYAALRLKYML